jgi:hypothetical protein
MFKDFIIGKPKRVVGVISYTVERFIDWKIEQGFGKEKPIDNKRKFMVDNTLYICLSKPEHVHGYGFDEVTHIDDAWENKDFDKIIDYCKPALKKGGMWNL